jgi:hypothetical protein
VTFAALNRAWIVLSDAPEKMTEQQYFQLLHEMGHAGMWSTLIRGIYPTFSFCWLFSLPIVIALVPLSRISLFWILLAVIPTSIVIVILRRRLRETIAFIDELYADAYAFNRCSPSTFRDGDPHYYAVLFCSDGVLRSSEAKLRMELFEQNVALVKAGQEAGWSTPIIRYLLSRLPLPAQGILLIVTYSVFGFFISQPTFIRLFILFLYGIVLVFVNYILHQDLDLWDEILDESFGFGEAGPEAKQLKERATKYANKFNQWMAARSRK